MRQRGRSTELQKKNRKKGILGFCCCAADYVLLLRACESREDTSGVSWQQGGALKPKFIQCEVDEVMVKTADSLPGDSQFPTIAATIEKTAAFVVVEESNFPLLLLLN